MNWAWPAVVERDGPGSGSSSGRCRGGCGGEAEIALGLLDLDLKLGSLGDDLDLGFECFESLGSLEDFDSLDTGVSIGREFS